MKRGIILATGIMLATLLFATAASAQSTVPPPLTPDRGNRPGSEFGLEFRPEFPTGSENPFHNPHFRSHQQPPKAKDSTTPPTIGLPGTGVAPTNDNLANATPISFPFSTTESGIEEATIEPGKLAFCNGSSNDVWFKLTIATTTAVDIDLADSDYDTVLVLHNGPTSATQPSQLSLADCDDDGSTTYRASALYGVKLTPGTYYLQISTYDEPLGSPGTLHLKIEAAGKPLPFYYNYPESGTYSLAPAAYMWYSSNEFPSGAANVASVNFGSGDFASLGGSERVETRDGNRAASTIKYDFTMNKTNGGTTQVFKLTDLTPEADTDGLVCDSSYCTLTLSSSNQALIISLNDYQWIVDAKNTSGSRPGANPDDTVFSTNFGVPPQSTSLYDQPPVMDSDPVQYEWYAVLDVVTYTFTVDQTLPAPDAGVIVLPDLTPADDEDELTCDLYQCRLTLAPASILADGSTNSWYVTTNNANGGTVSSTNSFVVDFTPSPGDFGLYTKALVYITDPLIFNWSGSRYADTYDLLISRTSPDSASVVDESGLTPAEDADALTCTEFYYCTYTPTNPAALFSNGDYSWTVNADNENGQVTGSGAPNSFTVDTDVAFDLLTPVNGSKFDSGGQIPSFTWEQITDPMAVSNNWEIYFSTDFGPYKNMSLRDLTEAADGDPLTCGAGVCTLAATGSQFGMNRNIFHWYAYTNVTYNGTINVGVYPDYSKFTVGTVPKKFHLTNGDFEDYNSSKFPDGWQVKGTLVKSKVKCNKPDKVVAWSGECAWLTKGVPGNGG
ncbi:MAG TPA: hypothetical protein VHL11_06810, partial [Phototrophicaceae bacterium]|nr:hypothetical protein [Phototrophicaceae bacterium]